MVAGVPPVRARKARYFEDRRLAERIMPPPKPSDSTAQPTPPDNWSQLELAGLSDEGNGAEGTAKSATPSSDVHRNADPANGGIRREPGLERHKDIAPDPAKPFPDEFELD